mgnify:CR=1 FL=1
MTSTTLRFKTSNAVNAARVMATLQTSSAPSQPCGHQTCQAKNKARFNTTPTTAAVIARTGAKVWEFSSVPQPGSVGHETWAGDSWRDRLGVNAWPFYFTVDEARGVAGDLGHRCEVTRDHGPPYPMGLDDRHAEPLEPGRVDDGGGAAVEARELTVPDATERQDTRPVELGLSAPVPPTDDREREIPFAHAGAIIRHADQITAAIFNCNVDAVRAGID